MTVPETHELQLSQADPDLEAKLAAFCDLAAVRAQAQGATGIVALRRAEGETLTCVAIPTGMPQDAVRIADHRQRGFEVKDRVAIRHQPAPASPTSDLLRRVQEAQRQADAALGKAEEALAEPEERSES